MIKFKPPLIYVQSLNIGHVWDGTAPTGAPTFPDTPTVGRDRIIQWAAENAGGKFNPVDAYDLWKVQRADPDRITKTPYVVEQAALLLGGQTGYELVATNGTDSLIVLSGTTEQQRISSELRFVMESEWWMELRSVGLATRIQRAALTMMPWDQRTY